MNQVNSYRKVHLESAIKNVGLLADNVWATNNLDKEYKQRNQDLWIRFNEAEDLGRDIVNANKTFNNVETVKDRIPQSRLATYGNFIYDRSEDLFYRSCADDNTETQYILNLTDYSEFWLCSEVEQEFRRLTCPIPIRTNVQNKSSLKPVAVLEEDETIQPLQTSMNVTPSQWLQQQPWPVYLLHYYPNISDSLTNSEKSLFNQGLNSEELKRTAAIIKHPPLRYSLNSPSEYEFHMKLNAASVKEIWDIFSPSIGSSITKLLETEPNDWKLTLPLIAFNCEVPEFYPKTILQRNWQMLPSASDPNYQIDLFPYQAPTSSTQTAAPSGSSASTHQSQPCTSTTAAPQTSSITSSLINSISTWSQPIAPITPQPIPVFQRPPEFYAQSEGVKPHKKRGGVEYSNLILLGRGSDNSNKTNNTNGDGSVTESIGTQADGLSIRCTEQMLNSEMISPLNRQVQNRSMEEMNVEKVTLEQINMWLDKVYPQRSEHFSEMMSTVDTIYNLASEVNKMKRLNAETEMNEPCCSNDVSGCGTDNSDVSQISKGAIKKIKSPSSSSSSSPQRQRRLYRDVLSGDAENRFAQLEQEALEQYQPSDHNISTVVSEETLAQRFQDLEREALEQYRGDRDDWFTEPLSMTGEDNGGSGDIEEVLDPPMTITPSRNTIHHQEIMEDHQVGIKEEEGEVTEEENQEKGDTKVTDNNVKNEEKQHKLKIIFTQKLQAIAQKPLVWMKQKKKRQDKKQKIIKQNKVSQPVQRNEVKLYNEFSNLINDFHVTFENCLKDQKNKKFKKGNQKKMIKNVIYQLKRINNLISDSKTLNEFKLNTEATNIVTFGGVIAPCIQMCLEINNGHDKYYFHDMVKRTIILKTFSMLFMPCSHPKCKSMSSLLYENYETKYEEISNTNNIGRHLYHRNSQLNLLKNNIFCTTTKNNLKICQMCFVNRILSRLAWSCFQTFISNLLLFAKLSTNLHNDKTKHQIFIKNTSFYHMKLNNHYEFRLNTHYERHCNDVMKHTEWQNIGSLINKNSGKYFVNTNLYVLIKDWSWIYYLATTTVMDIVLIDSVIDEVAIVYFSKLMTGIIDHTRSSIFQINWLDNEPCYYCNEFVILHCFNNADFISNLSYTKRKINSLKYECLNLTNKWNHNSKSQFNNNCSRKISNIYSPISGNEFTRSCKVNDKRVEGNKWKRVQMDGALDRKNKYLRENITGNENKLRRNKSQSKDESECPTPRMYSNRNEMLYYLKNYKKENNISFRKCSSDQFTFTKYEKTKQSTDEPIYDVALKRLSNSKKLKNIKGQKKSSIKFKENDKSIIEKHSCKNACSIQ